MSSLRLLFRSLIYEAQPQLSCSEQKNEVTVCKLMSHNITTRYTGREKQQPGNNEAVLEVDLLKLTKINKSRTSSFFHWKLMITRLKMALDLASVFLFGIKNICFFYIHLFSIECSTKM